MSNTPGWLQYVSAFAPLAGAIATLAVGFMVFRVSSAQAQTAASQRDIAAGQRDIAASQHNIARDKLRLELFERRLRVFDATWAAASSVSQTGDPVFAPHTMTNLYPEASFLFGPEIEVYMRELAHHMTRLAIIRQQTKQNGNLMLPNRIEENLEHETWIFEAAQTGIREKFQPYLSFERYGLVRSLDDILAD